MSAQLANKQFLLPYAPGTDIWVIASEKHCWNMHHRKEKAESDHQQTLCCILIVYNVKNMHSELSHGCMSVIICSLSVFIAHAETHTNTRALPDSSDETCHIRWHRPQLKGRIKPGLGDLLRNLSETLCVHCQTLWQNFPLSTFTC